MTVLLRKSAGGEWHEPAVTAYANEAHLQRILLVRTSATAHGTDAGGCRRRGGDSGGLSS